MFQGVYTALITPLRDGKVDYNDLEKLVEHQISGGIDGLVPMGTTGESPTMSHEEHRDVIRKVVNLVNGRVKVVPGTGSNSTREAVSLTRDAQNMGVDGVMVVNPYYNKPTQEGLLTHFEAVAGSVDIPCMLYNIPGRTSVNFQPENVARLMERQGNVKAMKEATGDINQMMRLRELCGDQLSILAGDDNLFFPMMAMGGNGVVSVLANIIPGDMKKIYTTFNDGDLVGSRDSFYKILPLCRAMFLETNPIPVKAAMAMLGYCSPEIRLPMTQLVPENRDRLEAALKKYGIKL